jgi:hypothetical protein
MKFGGTAVSFALSLLALLPAANAQTTSATITGTLTDPGGAAIVGASIQLTADVTKQLHEFKTGSNGDFQFQVTPGDYTLHVAQAGFKTYDQPGIHVASAERFDLHEIKLTVGDVATTLEVTGAVARVQTDSSDRSITVTTTQIEDTPTAGRNYLNMLRSLPGTAVTTTSDSRGGTGAANSTTTPAVNGGAGQMLINIDGIASQDSQSPNNASYIAPSMDAINEVQILVSNYSAEYGARNGGQMNITIKNGTQQFHGSAYFYYRHEEFDANEFFNNKNTVTINGIPGQAVAKPIYRYAEPGGTIGGPVIIPHTRMTRSNSKLFFFFSDDYLHHNGTNGPNYYTMPTAAERKGDFSASVLSTGALIVIKNPLNGQNPFPGNIIPQSQISPQGYALLNLFPLPNTTDPSGARGYNYYNQFTNSAPVKDKILRLDFPVGNKTQVFVRGLLNYYAVNGAGSIDASTGAGWGQFLSSYSVPSAGIAVNAIHTFRPNLINEFTWGINHSRQIVAANDSTSPCTGSINSIPTGSALPYSCSQLNNPNLKGPAGEAVTFPNFFPGANALNLIPNVSFGSGGGFSVQSAGQAPPGTLPSFGYDSRWPFTGVDQLSSVTDNLTWIKGKHTVKAGFYFEFVNRTDSVYSTYNTAGTFYFGSDTANPNDTNNPFSNALVGSAFAYGTDNKKQTNNGRYSTYETFVQDTWKASRRLTFDIGLRIQSIGPFTDQGATLGFFSAAAFNPNAVGQLLYPALNSAGKKVALNRVTGATYPYALVGDFDPASYPAGSYPWSGIVNYKSSFWNRGAPNLAPRIGFAWDLTGDGKTAIRGGFGIFYGRAVTADTIAATSAGNGPAAVAPNFLSPAYSYPTFASLAASTAYYSPQPVFGGSQDIKDPQTLQWSLGVQRDIGKGIILDASYVGWVTHHRFDVGGYDFNAVAPYTTWKSTPGPGTNSCGQVIAYLDPTAAAVNPTTCLGGAFLNSNLIRALVGYPGWSAIGVADNSGEVKYDALQVQINRRFGKRLQFGTNYTYSKQLQYARSQFLPDKLTYGGSANHPQVVNINFGYKLQDGTMFVPKNVFTSAVLDGWNINGVLSFYDGTGLTVSCGTSGSFPLGYWTGTPVDAPGIRCNMSGSLFLPAGATPASAASTADPRLWYPLAGCANNATAVAATGACSITPSFTLPSASSFGIGNTPLTLFYGPGFENADLSVYKDFRLGRESRVLQFRVEAFNALNHFNPGNPNTSLTYTYNMANGGTGTQTNANFGAITSAQNTARHLALSLRLRF